MTEEKLGSGIKLTEDWDLEVSSTGDIATVFGQDEIEKDLSVLLAIQTERKLGGVIDPTQTNNSLKELELLVERTILTDVRVSSVESVDAQVVEDQKDTVQVRASVTSDGEEYDLLVEVDE